MKKEHFTYHWATPIIMLMLIATSCKKEPGIHFPSSHCNILSIAGNFYAYDYDSIVFSYNAAGNPVSVVRDKPATGLASFHFRYDKFNRLTDYIRVYQPTSPEFETWHRYYYKNNQIVLDSIFQFGLLGDVPRPSPNAPNIFFRGFATFKYDHLGRISETVDSSGWGYGRLTRYYTYDDKGNLVRVRYQTNIPGYHLDDKIISGYDDKVNLRLTHPIWQFIDRMYSVNNPIKAVRYNKTGLPLAFGTNTNMSNSKILDPGEPLSEILELGNYAYVRIGYSCK